MGLVLRQAGYIVNHKRVRRLVQTMSIESDIRCGYLCQTKYSGLGYGHHICTNGRRLYALNGNP